MNVLKSLAIDTRCNECMRGRVIAGNYTIL